LPKTDGEIELASLNAPAEIIRDSNGVAHIQGDTLDAAYYALGFAHAQDRL
jgi:penicillin amidase